METKNLLTQIEAAIANRKPSPSDKWCLILKDDKIICVPVAAPIRAEQFIKRITLQNIRDGFTPEEWTKIARRVFRLIERTKKCQHHQKPLL